MEYVKDFMRDAFKDHRLRELFRNEHMAAFRMRNPKRGHYWADVYFSQGAIVILGDLRITDRPGIVGVVGPEAEEWFGGKLGGLEPEYLASKFLEPKPRSPKSKTRAAWENSVGWLAAAQQAFSMRHKYLPLASASS